MAKQKKSNKKAWVLGVGLDGRDGHTRITAGENFQLVGGSEETHEVMQEKAIKMNEDLKRRGKALEELSRQEFTEMADKVGMRLLDGTTSRPKKPKQ